MEEESKSVKDEVRELKQLMEEAIVDKKKPFKLPRKAKLSKRKARDNWITVIKINENGSFDFKREKIEDQTIVIDGIPRIATNENIIYYKNKPFIIQPSWSVKPFSKTENYEQAVQQQMNSNGFKILLEKMMSDRIKGKKKIGAGLIIVGILIVIGIIYVVSSGGI